MSHQRCIACLTTHENSKNVSFFKFPTDETRREIWIKKLELSNCFIRKTARVCSKHFSIESFAMHGLKRKQLRPNAVPLSHEEVMNNLERNGQKQTGGNDTAIIKTISKIQMQLNKQKPSTSSKR